MPTNKIAKAAAEPAPRVSRLDQLAALLATPRGASLAELVAATGWQNHSLRGAIAGALKKRGHTIISDKIDGVRRYKIVAAS